MTVKLRLTGEPDELARILDAISSVLDVATDGRSYRSAVASASAVTPRPGCPRQPPTSSTTMRSHGPSPTTDRTTDQPTTD